MPKPPGSGRKPGTPNKATTEVRAAIAKFAEGQADSFVRWVDAVAAGSGYPGSPGYRAPDPGKAADLYLKAIEYHIPKLARSEVTGEGGGPVTITVSPLDVGLL